MGNQSLRHLSKNGVTVVAQRLTMVYGWRSAAGSELFAVIQSAPAQTILSLWMISEGSAARHNINKI